MSSMKLYDSSGNGGINELLVQVSVLSFVIILSVDELNPVKVFADITGQSEGVIATFCISLLLLLLVNNFRNIIYFSVRIYLHSILSIFFKRIELVGVSNIPMEGPVIFTGNHANQFADAVIVMMTCQRKVGFIIAQKSWEHPVVGALAKIIGCIPVARPQDLAVTGQGEVTCVEGDSEGTYMVKGKNTQFLRDVKPRDMIRFKGRTVKDSGPAVKVEKVLDDETLQLSEPLMRAKGLPVKAEEFIPFSVIPHIDQSGMFNAVYRHLKNGNSIGIFPEGGSHDRTDLLPLKAGVAIMAFGVKEKYQISVPVVPVGLNYFRGHRFRGRATVEFGQPIYLTGRDMEEYRKDKRAATNRFLDRVSDGMRSVIVTAPDYDTLQGVYTARKLYEHDGIPRSPRYIQDMNRRFAEGCRLIQAKYKDDPRFLDLKKRVVEYRKKLKELALKDHQVPIVRWHDTSYVTNRLMYAIGVMCMTALPTLFLNAPVGIVARWAANVERAKALKASTVKVAGRDVMLSRKILVSMVGVPLLWIFYAIVLYFFSGLRWNAVLMLFLAFPLFSYFGVITTEAGMLAVSDIRPLFLRLLPSFREKQNLLAKERVALKRDIREFVHAHKEDLGELYYARRIDWPSYMAKRDALLRDGEHVKEEEGDILEDGEKVFAAISKAQEGIVSPQMAEEHRKKAD